MSAEQQQSPISLEKVKHVVLVLSGKGGVGKSSVTTQLALTLVNKGFSVGVLDIDLTGPSLPRMFGMESGKIHQSSNGGWIPVYYDQSKKLSLMSLGFLLNERGNSVVWRGPKKTAMIRQFLKDVEWPELDYLLIDTPPGTSDEHIAIAEELRYCDRVDGAVIVTTPQQISINDVKKEINFCSKVNFKILGVIENMSGFICPYCAECTNIFSSGGGENLSKELDLKYLGNVPIDPSFIELVERQNELKVEKNKSLIELYKDSNLAPIFDNITSNALSLS
ncbi:hypothetical protein B5S28_g1311 [[Candida] boidinii]|uniref:Unnamed protein product n=1 Tax=Candida boidinii TaxID=5477 RepID=A0ACB5TGU7_CANBO|nr:hypothetical protein B5S28_g1311 [[Candida] boidinii]OWB61160.1 hypothetical protein B5S29_g2044 [[Candida] boidinii]OWB74947.1 hypothetical protein B5S31_g4784 [[Candida] boidinii]OWB78081.1 hypothetical protein B5S32_g2266 [[Candida] boidinii]GME88350.1 unnamed protein product [[Candida] boidinii]